MIVGMRGNLIRGRKRRGITGFPPPIFIRGRFRGNGLFVGEACFRLKNTKGNLGYAFNILLIQEENNGRF
jgi:hypothetical protein